MIWPHWGPGLLSQPFNSGRWSSTNSHLSPGNAFCLPINTTPKRPMKSIAFFDLDGTITHKDTMIEFIRFTRGSFRLYLSLWFLSPMLILYALKLYPNDKAKRHLVNWHFKGRSREELEQWAKDYAEQIMPTLLRPAAVKRLEEHRAANEEIVIVTASLDLWLIPWMEQQNLKMIATGSTFRNGKLTGEYSTSNCYGPEKVKRIKAEYDLSQYDKIYAYGDSPADQFMLNLAHEPHFKPFR